jgi:hypothetical protein
MRDASDCSESPALAASSAGAISIVRNQSKHVHRVVSITRSDIALALTPSGDARAHHGRNVLRLDDRQKSSLVVPRPIFSITVSTARKLRCRRIEPVGQRAETLLSTFSVDNPVHLSSRAAPFSRNHATNRSRSCETNGGPDLFDYVGYISRSSTNGGTSISGPPALPRWA